MNISRTTCAAAALFLLAITSFPAPTEDDFLKPVGRPPRAKPQMRQGGEALPPLPLPATPLRRSEKKRPPSPATLIGKVIWGGFKDYRWDDGQVSRVYDWNMVPADCQQLLRAARRFLHMEYKVETTGIDTFNATPAQVPVLFFSGGRRLRLTDEHRAKLRNYMLQGGMVWFDSVVGSPFFYASAVEELARMFPEVPLKRLPADHPVFHMVDDAVHVSVRTENDMRPVLDGLYIGSRLAAVVSPYGLGCGWDNASPHLITQANYYDRRSAMVLGLNLVAYALGYFRVGLSHARAEVFRDRDLVADADPVTFAQIRTNGIWHTEPGAAANLLRFMSRNLYVKTNYRRVIVDLAKDDLDGLPMLYLAGISDFSFTSAERQALRAYLLGGGCLLADNALGMKEFDQALKRELQLVLPRSRLKMLPPDHALFTDGPFPIQDVHYTVAVRAAEPTRRRPALEGVVIDGDLRVLYSPFDLAAGWQGDEHPLARGYLPGEALQLGADVITYFLTH